MTYVIGRTYAPGAWQRWVLDQDEVWVNAKGEVMRISDMSREYALNVLLFLHEKKRPSFEPFSNPLIQALRKRVLA